MEPSTTLSSLSSSSSSDSAATAITGRNRSDVDTGTEMKPAKCRRLTVPFKLMELPHEILAIVLSFVTIRTGAKLLSVNETLRRIVTEQTTFVDLSCHNLGVAYEHIGAHRNDALATVTRSFPRTDRLIVGCRSYCNDDVDGRELSKLLMGSLHLQSFTLLVSHRGRAAGISFTTNCRFYRPLIAHYSTLKFLVLRSFAVDSVTQAAAILRPLKNLVVLKLAGISFGNDIRWPDIGPLTSAVGSLRDLQEISWSGQHQLTDDNVCDILRDGLPELRDLRLECTYRMTVRMEYAPGNRLVGLLTDNSFVGCLTDRSLVAISQHCPKLGSLDVTGHSSLTVDGFKEALTCVPLRSLRAANTKVEPTHLKELVSASSTLLSIDIGSIHPAKREPIAAAAEACGGRTTFRDPATNLPYALPSCMPHSVLASYEAAEIEHSMFWDKHSKCASGGVLCPYWGSFVLPFPGA